MDAPVLETEIRVMFFDTDAGKLVHNLAYLRFIETNRSLLAEKLGWDLRGMVDGGECPVVIRTEIDYRRPARLWDRLVIKGWLEKYERSRFWCGFEIRRAGEEEVLVRARQMLAVVTLPEMKVVRLPPSWDEKYGHLRRMAGPDERYGNTQASDRAEPRLRP